MGGSAASGRRPSAFRIDAAPTCPRRIACYRPGSLTGPGGRGGTGRRAGFRFQYRKMWGFESLRPHQTAANADGRAPKDYDFRKVALSMQTAETLNEGLKRAYKLVIPAKDIAQRVATQLAPVAPQVRMPGFRPGKGPANLVRKMHGPALEQEALQTAVQDSVQKLLADNKLRPAMQPSVDLAEGYEAGKDAEVTVELEVLPEIPTPQIEGLKLERLMVEATGEEIEAALERIVSQQKSFEEAPKTHKAAFGDLVVMDFVGKVDGEPFEGGTGEGMSVEIGSGRLIPGFEDQLAGVKAGDEKTLNVTFPEDYNVDYLKGKADRKRVVSGKSVSVRVD